MNPSTTPPDAGSGSTPSPHRGRFWQALVVVLLTGIVVSNLALMRLAGADPSVAAEPDAHRKASAWDERVAARRRSDRLGWRTGIAATVGAQGEIRLSVRVSDVSDHPVGGAQLDLEGFAIARSGQRLILSGVTDAAGQAGFRVEGAPGLWEWRFSARRGEDAHVGTLRLQVEPGAS